MKILSALRNLFHSKNDPPGRAALERLESVLIDNWWPDRSLSSPDYGERRLVAALALAYPERIHTVERCAVMRGGCGEYARGCEECMSEKDVPAFMDRCRAVFSAASRGDAANPEATP